MWHRKLYAGSGENCKFCQWGPGQAPPPRCIWGSSGELSCITFIMRLYTKSTKRKPLINLAYYCGFSIGGGECSCCLVASAPLAPTWLRPCLYSVHTNTPSAVRYDVSHPCRVMQVRSQLLLRSAILCLHRYTNAMEKSYAYTPNKVIFSTSAD